MLAALQATDHDINSNVMCVIWYFCDNWPANEKEKKNNPYNDVVLFYYYKRH